MNVTTPSNEPRMYEFSITVEYWREGRVLLRCPDRRCTWTGELHGDSRTLRVFAKYAEHLPHCPLRIEDHSVDEIILGDPVPTPDETDGVVVPKEVVKCSGCGASKYAVLYQVDAVTRSLAYFCQKCDRGI
jgi:hypothetical protein